MCNLWIGIHKSAMSGITFGSSGGMETVQTFSTIGIFQRTPLFSMIVTCGGSTASLQLETAGGTVLGSTTIQPGDNQLVRLNDVNIISSQVYVIKAQTNDSGYLRCWEYNLGQSCAPLTST